MTDLVTLALMTALAATAVAIARTPSLVAAAMLGGVYSFLSATVFVAMDAVDVAFTEAAVGAGVSGVLMLAAMTLTTRKERTSPVLAVMPLAIVVITGAALVYASFDMPWFGAPDAPIHNDIYRTFIDGHRPGGEIDLPNTVTGILASYRGFDTMGETIVVFTAGVGVLALLGSSLRRRWGAGRGPGGAGEDR